MKKLSQEKPNPQKAKKKLLDAINNKTPADWLLYDVLKDASVTVGPVTIQIWPNFEANLKEYREAWLVLTSPKGRKYIKKQMDVVFDYLEQIIKGDENEQKTNGS